MGILCLPPAGKPTISVARPLSLAFILKAVAILVVMAMLPMRKRRGDITD